MSTVSSSLPAYGGAPKEIILSSHVVLPALENLVPWLISYPGDLLIMLMQNASC